MKQNIQKALRIVAFTGFTLLLNWMVQQVPGDEYAIRGLILLAWVYGLIGFICYPGKD